MKLLNLSNLRNGGNNPTIVMSGLAWGAETELDPHRPAGRGLAGDPLAGDWEQGCGSQAGAEQLTQCPHGHQQLPRCPQGHQILRPFLHALQHLYN